MPAPNAVANTQGLELSCVLPLLLAFVLVLQLSPLYVYACASFLFLYAALPRCSALESAALCVHCSAYFTTLSSP
jgi:hypothetical protein